MGETQDSNRCRICGSDRVALKKTGNVAATWGPKDLRITDSRYGHTFTLLSCASCRFVFADAKELAGLTASYEALEDPQYEQAHESRVLQMRWILSRILKVKPGARSLLDIGAGTGLLLAEAEKRGLDAIGVEPSRHFSETASRLGCRVLPGVFPNTALEYHRFDIITLIDVIEHVQEPLALLEACGRALLPDGVLVIVTPDFGSAMARLFRHRWWHFRLAHIACFNRTSLSKALCLCSLRIDGDHRAVWFFPIGYLAERLERYLPFLSWFNRAALRCFPLRRLYGRVISLNLHDSFFVILKRTEIT